MSAIAEYASVLGAMPKAKRDKVVAEAIKKVGERWVPNEGPQTQAYFSQADILLYGGQAGGGKSQLVIGWGVNESQTGIIFRRELSQTDGLERDGKLIIKERARFNGQSLEWTWASGKTLKLGGMQMADSWIAHAGRERDYVGFDEGGEFLEIQVASIMAWLRAPTGKRTRMIIASNPPRSAEGLWLIEWFAPWLDETHELYPAAPGDLRWAVYVSQSDGTGRTIWVDGPGEYTIEGETYTAKSRTFIPASLEDNPYRNNPEYRATLQNLPEPLRSQLLYGDWKAGLKDHANQVVPTEWVKAAMDRWTPRPPEGIPMCAIGVDASGGGDDPMVQAIRHDYWYAPLIKTPGAEIPRDRPGSYAAGLVLANRRDRAVVIVDLGGGYGGPLYEHLRTNDIEALGYKGAEATIRRTKDKKLGFTNTRSAAYWAFREALDPTQPGGSRIALPKDQRLLAGLTAATFEITPRGIQVEPKVRRNEKGKVSGGVMAKLGFSPDESDAVVMAWWAGPKEITHALEWATQREQRRPLNRRPEVVMGRHHARR